MPERQTDLLLNDPRLPTEDDSGWRRSLSYRRFALSLEVRARAQFSRGQARVPSLAGDRLVCLVWLV